MKPFSRFRWASACAFICLVSFLVPSDVRSEESIRPHISEAAAVASRQSGKIEDWVNVAGWGGQAMIGLGDDQLFFVDRNGNVTARDIVARRLLWSLPHAADATHPLVTVRGTRLFYVAPAGKIIAVDIRTGHAVWRSISLGESVERMSFNNGSLYAGVDNLLIKIRANNGSVIWRKPAFVAGKIFFGSGIIALTTASGTPISSSVHILDSGVGNELYSIPEAWNWGNDNAAILNRENNIAYIAVTHYAGTIDADKLAVKIVEIDADNGHLLRVNDYHPDLGVYDSDTRVAENIVISEKYIIFQLGSSTYVYRNDRNPSDQHPLRLGNVGVPVKISGDEAFFLDSHGLSSIHIMRDSLYRRRLATFRYDEARRRTSMIVGNSIIAATSDILVVFNFVTKKLIIYPVVHCSTILAATENDRHMAILCGNENFLPQRIVLLKNWFAAGS